MPRLTRRIGWIFASSLVAATALYAQSREWKSGVNWAEPKIVTPGRRNCSSFGRDRAV